MTKRFIPSFADHITRYSLAMNHCYKNKVMDAGCTYGFGTHLLSYGANSVTAVDINDDFLYKAKNYYKYFCPVEFIKCDFNTSFPDGLWDTVVSFEVIEHVADPDFFIKNVSEHLNVGGELVFSVPHMVANRQHITLFDEKLIKDLISKYLHITEFYIQDSKTLSHKPLYKGLKCYVGVAKKI